MRTISIANLKAHLSAELKKVQDGHPVTVLDHKRPVAVLAPLTTETSGPKVVSFATLRPNFSAWGSLTSVDPLAGLAVDREDR